LSRQIKVENISLDRRKHVFQFKVELRDITPIIWRRIQVPGSYTFWDFHVAIQDVMGWFDCHLHLFRVENPETDSVEEIGIPDEDSYEGEPDLIPGWEVHIADYFKRPGDSASYEYDFGDGWEHAVVLEDIVEKQKGRKYPVCVAGARACPPEDCGGVPGYEDLLVTINDPTSEEYESTMEWLGGQFDPEQFDPAEVVFENPKRRWKFAFTDED
jgi:hypothetical protein